MIEQTLDVSLTLDDVSVDFHIYNPTGRSLKKHLVAPPRGGASALTRATLWCRPCAA